MLAAENSGIDFGPINAHETREVVELLDDDDEDILSDFIQDDVSNILANILALTKSDLILTCIYLEFIIDFMSQNVKWIRCRRVLWLKIFSSGGIRKP